MEPRAAGAAARAGLSLLASPFGVGVAARIAVQVVAFVQIMVAARFIDLSGFGTYTLGWAACVIAVSFVYTGFYQALLRSPAFEAARHTGFWAMAMIGGGGALVLALVGAALIAARPETAAVFLGLAPVPAIRALVAWNEVHLVRDRRVRLVSIYGVLAEATALAVTWGSLVQGAGIFALVFGRYVALAVEAGMALGASRSLPALSFSARWMRELRQTALPLWGTSALGMFSNYGADLILGAFLNTGAVGAYRSGARISQTAADLVYQPLNTITWSRMSHLEKDGRRDGFKTVWLEHMGFGAVVLWPVLVAIAVLARELVTVVFDDSWLPAAPVIVILCLSRAFGYLSILLESTLVCQGRGAMQVKVRAIAAAVSLIGLLAFGRFGAEEAAAAHVLASAVAAILSIRAIRSALKFSLGEAARALLPAAALSALCLLGLLATRPALAALGGSGELLVMLAGLAAVWVVAVGWFLKRRLVVLPRP